MGSCSTRYALDRYTVSRVCACHDDDNDEVTIEILRASSLEATGRRMIYRSRPASRSIDPRSFPLETQASRAYARLLRHIYTRTGTHIYTHTDNVGVSFFLICFFFRLPPRGKAPRAFPASAVGAFLRLPLPIFIYFLIVAFFSS